jgi:Uma2 family endonuclease
MAMRATLDDQATLPLENGDRLTREEFERRYEASAEVKKAELIDGVAYLASPMSRNLSGPQSRMNAWLAVYADSHPGSEAYPNVTVRLLRDSEVQPDVLLRRTSGESKPTPEGYFSGAPELVVEIATSSASVDMHAKRLLYERAGVPEYIIWRTRQNRVDWFVLENGRYLALEPDADGVLESRQFPGLRLSVDVLLDGTLADLLALLR